MKIVIGHTTTVNVNPPPINSNNITSKKNADQDRRKRKQDRRKSVRDGVIVSLSFKKDRRVRQERRKNSSI